MKDLVFVSVSFGPRYIAQQDRLKESILSIYPDANLLFFRDELPPGAKPFLESIYGFKVQAIQKAIDLGYTKILWLDTAIILKDKIDILLDHEMVAVQDDNLLHGCISKKYAIYSGYTRQEIEGLKIHLIGGSLYYFDFQTSLARNIFNGFTADEKGGWFGSQEQESAGQLNGHRWDEACMAMTIFHNDHAPVKNLDIKYNVGDQSIFIKKHFK